MNNTLLTCLKFFGLTNKETKKALDSVAITALRATYYFVACKKYQVIWKFEVGELSIHPTHQSNWSWVIICFTPNRIRTPGPAWQGLPSGLLLKGLLGKKWKGLARWFKLPIPTDPGLKWGNYYHYNYYRYCQVIPRCQDSCCTGEGGFRRPKRSTHSCSSQVGGSCNKLERLIQQELKYLGFIWIQHRAPLYTAIKKHLFSQEAAFTRLWNFTHFNPNT